MESFNIRARKKNVRAEAKEASGKKSQSGRKKAIEIEVVEDSGDEVVAGVGVKLEDLGEEKPTTWRGDERISLVDSDIYTDALIVQTDLPPRTAATSKLMPFIVMPTCR